MIIKKLYLPRKLSVIALYMTQVIAPAIAPGLAAQLFLTSSAQAAGFQINELSPGLQGDASAGAAAANNDVSALFFNPATLSTLKQNQVYIGGNEILPNLEVSNAQAVHTVNTPGIPASDSTPVTVTGQTSQSNIGAGAFVPDAYIGWRLHPKLVAGLAVIAPYGLKTHYAEDSVLRFAAIYSAVRTIDIVPSIAYMINEKWSLGLGFQAQYLQATFSNFNGPYTGDADIDALFAANHPTYLKGDAWGYGYTLGALYKPDDCTRVGLGYRSQISEQLKGHGQQYTLPGETVPAPSQEFLFNADTPVNAKVRTPAILTLSAARDYAEWTFKASAQLNFWNTFNQLSVNMPQAFATNITLPTKWKNSWFTALGVERHLSPAWTLRAGTAYDQTPTVGYRDPRIPDNDRVWLNIGATYQANKHLSFDAVYSHIFIPKQTVNVTQAGGSNAITTEPLEVNQVYAQYTGSADIIGVAARFSF
jgi:long-chain fatty acid transport protein